MHKTKLVQKTFFLFPGLNFRIGLGSTFSMPGNYYKSRYLKTTQEADKKAIESDWDRIGQDMKNVIAKYPVNKCKLL